MSWNINITKVRKEEFNEAVDAAEVIGQEASVVAEAVSFAKEQLKAAAAHITRPFIYANAGGHVLEEGQDQGWHEGLTLQVTGIAD